MKSELPVVVNVYVETPQQRFARLYISSSEICAKMNIARSSLLLARRRGLLPDPIAIPGCTMFVWERATVQPYLDAWKLLLDVRREHAAQTAIA